MALLYNGYDKSLRFISGKSDEALLISNSNYGQLVPRVSQVWLALEWTDTINFGLIGASVARHVAA